MFKLRKAIIHVLMVATILLQFACYHISQQKDVMVVEGDTVRQIELLPFPKDSVLIGIKWLWVETFSAGMIEERFALNLQNRSETPVMLDSVYEIGAWRNRDSTYTLLYRDTFNRLLSIEGYSVLCDTLHPKVKDVFRSKSDYDEYLFTIRAWCKKCDSIKLAYHITEPDVWEENGTATFNLNREETIDSIWVILHNPMIIDVGTDYNNLINKMYICRTERPDGNGKS